MKLFELLKIIRSDKNIMIYVNTGYVATLKRGDWHKGAYPVSPVAVVCEEEKKEILNAHVAAIDDNSTVNALIVFLDF